MASRVSVTVPIWLSLISDGVGDAALDGAGDDRRVGAEVVVADEFDLAAEPGGERDPALVVVLAEPVLDQVHREPSDDGGDRSIMSPLVSSSPGDPVAAVGLAELRGRRVQRDGHPVAARLVPGVADRLHQQAEDLFGLGDLRGEPALVAQPGGQLAAGQLTAQRRVDLGAGPDRLGHRRGADRRDHELLEVE